MSINLSATAKTSRRRSENPSKVRGRRAFLPAPFFLLLDVGHTLLSREKPWEIVAAAGGKLGYVQMNDNDGKRDRHWALLDGVLSFEDLSRTVDALKQAGYERTLGLQLSGSLRLLAPEFSRNRNLLIRVQIGNEQKSFKEPETRRKKQVPSGGRDRDFGRQIPSGGRDLLETGYRLQPSR